MSEVLRENQRVNTEGLILIERNRYDNIVEVTHKFSGSSTIEEVMKDIVISKIKEKM
ncbi:hypothetical protein ACR77J_14935 [Tissierella praeacuta]|uniref:hypothetical protein n=1 Tax=Tissierella praeacuta TaxID=43131 RepID=UPI0028A6E979|nr:hypothetical protein [Tissierella praeacuta]